MIVAGIEILTMTSRRFETGWLKGHRTAARGRHAHTQRRQLAVTGSQWMIPGQSGGHNPPLIRKSVDSREGCITLPCCTLDAGGCNSGSGGIERSFTTKEREENWWWGAGRNNRSAAHLHLCIAEGNDQLRTQRLDEVQRIGISTHLSRQDTITCCFLESSALINKNRFTLACKNDNQSNVLRDFRNLTLW